MSSPWGLRGLVCGLAVAALAAFLLTVVIPPIKDSSKGRARAAAAPKHEPARDAQALKAGDQAPTPAKSRLTFAEMAALALTEGVRLEDRDSSVNSTLESTINGAASDERRALFALLRTGNDADALAAIREFARLGGEANCTQLAAIMKDEGWSDAVRTEAALALLKAGTPADAVLSVRILAVIGGDANTGTLKQIVSDTTMPQVLRVEAALGLGTIGSPEAGDVLVAAFGMFSAPEIHEQLLDALGHFPFGQIEDTWKQYLAAPDTPDYLRVAAVEALSNSTPESVEFLKTLAAADRDPNVREEAVWAISVQGKNGPLGPELARMAVIEPEPDVRRRLYEALLTQAENPAETLLPTIREETDIAARVAGFNALANAVKRGSSSGLAAEFDGRIVRELTDIALSSNTLNVRMRAVFALRRSETASAMEALRVISATQNPKIAQAAAHGLRASK